MRGKVDVGGFKIPVVGITPAYAGKSAEIKAKWNAEQDHPRLCGEKFWSTLTFGVALGSPPPMRGKDGERCSHDAGLRITPAYAGKSWLFRVSCSVIVDHPRLCGEKAVVFSDAYDNLGSPPPMRGKD